MKKIPAALIPRFKALLVSNRIPGRYHAYYLKWLRYYLDFCHKYGFDESDQQSLPAFIRKLEKRQAAASQEQAFAAIRMYYGLIESGADHSGRALLPKPEYLQPLEEPQKPVQKPTPAKEIYQPSGKPKKRGSFLKPGNTGVITSTKPLFRRLSGAPSTRRKSASGPGPYVSPLCRVPDYAESVI